MPSHSVKQAKTMSAIAHGWHPTGSAGDIPVSVAKEFHAADAGHKYGHKASSSRSYMGYGGGVTVALPGQSRANDPDHPQMDPHRGLSRMSEHPSYPGDHPRAGHFNGTAGGDQIGRGHHSKYHGHSVEAHCFRGARGRTGS